MVLWRACLMIVCGVALLTGSPRAWSLPTSTFQVSASIVAGCVISGTNTGVFGALNFGSQSGVSATTVNASFVQSTSINLACTPGTTLSMSINQGSNFTTTRNLKLPGYSSTVPYTLFRDASRTTVIPVNQSVPLSYSNASNITLPIYGQLKLPGTARAGVYTDTLTVTLSW